MANNVVDYITGVIYYNAMPLSVVHKNYISSSPWYPVQLHLLLWTLKCMWKRDTSFLGKSCKNHFIVHQVFHFLLPKWPVVFHVDVQHYIRTQREDYIPPKWPIWIYSMCVKRMKFEISSCHSRAKISLFETSSNRSYSRLGKRNRGVWSWDGDQGHWFKWGCQGWPHW